MVKKFVNQIFYTSLKFKLTIRTWLGRIPRCPVTIMYLEKSRSSIAISSRGHRCRGGTASWGGSLGRFGCCSLVSFSSMLLTWGIIKYSLYYQFRVSTNMTEKIIIFLKKFQIEIFQISP